MTLQQLSFFYHNFAVMLNAGINITDHFETLRNAQSDPEQKTKLTYIIEHLKKGEPASRLLQRTALVPVFDAPLIETGEKSGRLVQVFQLLAKYYQLSADTEKEIRGGLYYPLFLFTAALFIPKFPALILGNVSAVRYFLEIALTLSVVVGIVWYLFTLHRRSYFDAALARTKFNLFQKIPFLRDLARDSALEKFCTSLSLMLESGVNLIDALRLAGQTSPSDEIQLAARRIASEVKGGMTLPLAFNREVAFTEDIRNSIAMGVQSGELPGFLNRSAMVLRDQVARNITMISKVVPQIVYVSTILYVGWTILAMHVQNFKNLANMMGGM